MRPRVALIQHRAYDIHGAQEGLERTLSMVDQAVASGADLIVLPECSYPGYYLGLQNDPLGAASSWELALDKFRHKAAQHKVLISLGIAEICQGTLYNSAFLMGPDGSIMGHARKTFLWHFDNRWFTPGDEYRVFDTPLGPVGMIICADGRMPEISRELCLAGANIIINTTCWVTTGRDPKSLRNPQVDYIIPTRAFENGAWFVCANKVGSEADSIVYCGQSMVASPQGEVVAKASPHRQEIVLAELELETKAHTKAMALRREHYSPEFSLIGADNQSTPLGRLLDSPLVPRTAVALVALAQLSRDVSFQDYVNQGGQMASQLSQQGVNLVVLPEAPCTSVRDAPTLLLEALGPIADRLGIYLAATARRPRSMTVVSGPKGFARIYGREPVGASGAQDPLRKSLPGSGDLLEIGGGVRVGFMRGYAGFVPEVPRILFLKGADLIVWQADLGMGLEQNVALTRAIENRSYVALANCSSKDDSRNSLLVSPDGHVVAETFPGVNQAVVAQISASASRIKQLTWGTNVFTGRLPHLYQKTSQR